ncbi:MAG TPA: SPOR domain-containing protein [Gemmatimonadota bacterium]|nr:SPOR domain-containing protein [Gemmatimonadota bacterium]
MRGRAVPLIAALAAGLACAGPYAERPPAADPRRETAERPPAEADRTAGAGSEGTVVGHVTPEGRIQADTIAQAPAPEPVERETVVTGHVRPATGAIGSAPGWRVQVFAARDQATANEVARRAGDLVPGVPVYVVAEESWYKVRLGDFASRQAAEPLRERLIGLGWTEAWTVRTGIHAP